MTWFEPVTGDVEDAFRSALVSVRRRTDGKLAGGGICLGGRYVLTCAHVVNEALGRDQMDPGEPEGATVQVRFTDGSPDAAEYGWAELAEWIPPTRRDGSPPVLGRDTMWEGDFAILVLTADPPRSVRAPQWRELTAGQRLRAWYGTGQAVSAVDGTVKMVLQHGAYLESDTTPRSIGPGFSGGPLWSRADRAATGLVAGALTGAGSGLTFVIPWQKIVRQSRLLRDAGPAGAAARTPAAPDPELVGLMTDALTDLLRGRAELAAAARAVCGKLDLAVGADGTAPGAEEFAEFLLGCPRAAAALVEHFWEEHREQQAVRLLEVCHEVDTPRILSPLGHRKLIGLLDDLHTALPGRLPSDRAVLAALRIPVPDRIGRGRAGRLRTVDELEARRAEPGRVFPLLRYVEHLASALVRRDDTEPYGKRLRRWSQRTAGQHGIPEAGLLEQRAVADEWAATAAAPTGSPRVVVRLGRYEHGGPGSPARFRRSLWVDRGDGTLIAAGPPDDRPVPPHQVAAEVLALVGDLAGEGDLQQPEPALEVFLEQRELSLPVEEWAVALSPASTALGGPEPLGVLLPLVVRLDGELPPYLVRQRPRELARRWQIGAAGEPLDLGEACTMAKHAVGQARSNPDTGWAVIRGGTAARRTELAAACLTVGIPIVLWDRSAIGAIPDDFLAELVRDRPQTDAPEQLRRYRALAYGFHDRHALKPVLAWEDPGRPGPRALPLTAPDDRPRWECPSDRQEEPR
ncbi:VMAP-C domain-containing protein [Kitasatospora sp. NPDC004531]